MERRLRTSLPIMTESEELIVYSGTAVLYTFHHSWDLN